MTGSRPAVAIVFLLTMTHGASGAEYHHVHVIAPAPGEAVNWYVKHLGATSVAGLDGVRSGEGLILWSKGEPAGGSAGTALDHIGFSVSDLAKKMAELEAAGVKIVTPLREVPNLFKIAFIEDPWGTKIELVEDAEFERPNVQGTQTGFFEGSDRVRVEVRQDSTPAAKELPVGKNAARRQIQRRP